MLNSLSIQIWEWCIQKSLWVSAVHIAGKLNCDADYKSCVFNYKHEYMLNKAVFQSILHSTQTLILIIIIRLNKQLDDNASWNTDLECKFVNVFSVNWKAHNFYAFHLLARYPDVCRRSNRTKPQA